MSRTNKRRLRGTSATQQTALGIGDECAQSSAMARAVRRYDISQQLPELHADMFSRHASPLQVCVFVTVDERGEGVMSDEICRRCNGKHKKRGVAAEVCSSQTGL